MQIGLRGELAGAGGVRLAGRARGSAHHTAEDVRREGIDEVVAAAIAIAGPGPAYLSVDIDVLDPAFAGPTGTPEAGGLHAAGAAGGVRALAEALDLRGVDVVETVPGGWGTADPGAAQRRRGHRRGAHRARRARPAA